MLDPDAAPPDLQEELVVANRILALDGIFDAFGHVSARDPRHHDRYVIARRISPNLVTADDLQVQLLDGEVVGGASGPAYSERFIHGAIYASRPDVAAICHSHSPSTIPFGVTGQPLRPIYHMASLLGGAVPVWDMAERYGDQTDLMVRNLGVARSLAESLGDGSAVLMRGHGNVVVGGSVPEVVLATTYMEENAKLLMQALALGEVRYLSDGEIEKMIEVMKNPIAAERAYGRWRSRLGV